MASYEQQLDQVQWCFACMVQVHRQVVLVGGRYLKLKRGVSQTPWLLSGQQAPPEASVEVCGRQCPLQHIRCLESL